MWWWGVEGLEKRAWEIGDLQDDDDRDLLPSDMSLHSCTGDFELGKWMCNASAWCSAGRVGLREEVGSGLFAWWYGAGGGLKMHDVLHWKAFQGCSSVPGSSRRN